MKTATIRDLRSEFARVSKWLDADETVQLLTRGQPSARVVPEPKSKSLIGCMKGTAKMSPVFNEPLDLEWEAMK